MVITYDLKNVRPLTSERFLSMATKRENPLISRRWASLRIKLDINFPHLFCFFLSVDSKSWNSFLLRFFRFNRFSCCLDSQFHLEPYSEDIPKHGSLPFLGFLTTFSRSKKIIIWKNSILALCPFMLYIQYLFLHLRISLLI